MPWTTVNFGTHRGKTLPQIIFSDPDWFFWAIEKDVFRQRGEFQLATEAADLNRKARHIRIPVPNMVAEYIVHPTAGGLDRMDLVPINLPRHEGASRTFRKPVIDLSSARRVAENDTLGNKNLISSVKSYLFGSPSFRMTIARCEAFFDDPDNFTRE